MDWMDFGPYPRRGVPQVVLPGTRRYGVRVIPVPLGIPPSFVSNGMYGSPLGVGSIPIPYMRTSSTRDLFCASCRKVTTVPTGSVSPMCVYCGGKV